MEPQTRRRAAWADIREFLVRAGALAALLVMLFGVVFGLYIQPDAAMHPHLKASAAQAGSRPGAATRWK